MKGRGRGIAKRGQPSTVTCPLAHVRKQRLVADDQRGIVVRQHRLEIWTVRLELGWIWNSRAQNTRVSATEVRELVSSAIDRTSAIGLVV